MSDDRHQESESQFLPVVTVAPLGELEVYPIYRHELDEFEKGSTSQLCLNFALALFASGLSFLSTLLATEIESVKTFSVFVILTVVFLLAGVVLLAIWWKLQRSTKHLAQRIRDRLPRPRGMHET